MLFAFCPATAKHWSSILMKTNLDPPLSCRNLFSTIILWDSNYPVSDFGVGTATVVFRHALTKIMHQYIFCQPFARNEIRALEITERAAVGSLFV